jgi:hypothetical protein
MSLDIGTARDYASAPTLDTERKSVFQTPIWDPGRISIFDHFLTIDIPTGNLTIDVTDVSYKYQGSTIGVTRKYDVQEQYMQITYLANYCNVDPKPHFFGNWRSGLECDVEDVWLTSTYEIQTNSGQGPNGLFCQDGENFIRNISSQSTIASTLNTFGVSSTMLDATGWAFQSDRDNLKSLRRRKVANCDRPGGR